MSIGAASILLLATLTVIFAIRRGRQKATTQPISEVKKRTQSFQGPGALTVRSAQELDNNSMIEPFRELPDSAKARAELLNEQAPSGSGNEVPEMPDGLPHDSHELNTSRDSFVMVQIRSANTCKNFTASKIPRKSWTTIESSGDPPCVETVTCALAQQENSIINSPSTINSNLEAEILSLYTRTSLDLNRSLPPTPISESPQVSPVQIRFYERLSLCKHPQMVKIPTRGSGSIAVSSGNSVPADPATYTKALF